MKLFNNNDIIILILGRAIQVLLSIITIRIATEILSPYEFGRMGIIMAIIGFIGFCFINPIGMYINRFLLTWNNEGTAKRHMGYFTLYLVVVAALSAAITVVVHHLFSLSIGINDIWLLSLIISYIIANVLTMTFIPSLNLLGNRASFVILITTTLIAILVIPIILTKTLAPIMEYWLLGQITGFGIMAVIGWYVFQSKLKPSFNNIRLPVNYKAIAPIIIFAVPLAVSVGLNWVQLQSYRFFLSSYSGLEVLGLFIAGYTISSAVLSAVESIVMQYLMPLFYMEVTNTTNEKLGKAWTKYAMFMIPALVITVVFTIFAAPYLVKLLLAASYQNAVQFVLWGAMIEGFRVLGNTISMAAHAIVDTKTLVIPNLIGALCVTTGLFSLPKFIEPTLAVGISLTIGGLIYCITLYIILNKIIRLNLDTGMLILSVIVSIPLAVAFIIVQYLYSNLSLPGAIIVIGGTGIVYLVVQTIIYLKWSKKYQ